MARPTIEDRLAKIGADAAERRDEMHKIYVVTLLPITIAEWGDIIEAIELEGWHLVAFELAKEGHAVAVFRVTDGA